MANLKNLVYALIFGALVFFVSLSVIQSGDLKNMQLLVEDQRLEHAGIMSELLRDMLSGEMRELVRDQAGLARLARDRGIHRIIILSPDGRTVNDSQGSPAGKAIDWISPDTARRVISGELLSAEIPGPLGKIEIALARLDTEGRSHILGVSLGRPINYGPISNAVFVVAAGTLVLLIIILVFMRFFLAARPGGQAAGGGSQVGFMASTFHELVGELKKKELELKRLRAVAESRADAIEGYNENILQSVPAGVISVDVDGSITKLNSSARRILGLSEDEAFAGSPVSGILSGSLLDELGKGKRISRGETLYTLNSGKSVWLGYSLTPLVDEDAGTIGEILVFTDLTELKSLESQAMLRDRLSSLGEMAAGIAHELRNPMGVIAGYTKMLSKKVGEPLKPTVDEIGKEVSVMNRIIDDFLTFARPGKPVIEAIDLGAVLGECLASNLRPGIEAVSDIAPGLAVSGDPVMLRQAFGNIVQNAVEAMKDGGRLAIAARREGVEAVITVTDTGYGIDESILDKIFLPFYTTKERGTGLGLAIVHRTILALGGRVSVQSGKEGTAFRVALPLR